MNKTTEGHAGIPEFSDTEMTFQLMRQLGASAYRASSIGECVAIANTVQQNNAQEWVQEFERLAEWQKKDGIERLVNNHVVSGREQLLRASNSFRAAEYYTPQASEHSKKLGLNSIDCFCSALAAMDLHFENHSIPYTNISLPAYFISPANDGMKRKTILILSGFDETMEESFFFRGFGAIERGYNVILFAGPGSIDVLRKYSHTCFKPDFEQILKRIINYFEFRQEIDKHNLSLMGLGTGAYFSIQATCHEPRIKALIVNSPILDLHAYLSAYILNPSQSDAKTDHFIQSFGQGSVEANLEYLKFFVLNESLSSIKAPCLALIGEQEGNEPKKQFDEFCKQMDATHYIFSNAEGAGSHCQIGNSSFANAVAYDWLDGL
ncbi:MAG: alpha/beta hydrolase family protein [Legionellales bacterium]